VLKSKVKSWSVTFTNTINNSHGGISSATSTVTFQIVVLDPCNTAVITPPTIAATLQVTNGQTQTFTFSEAVDDVATANSIVDICGVRTYLMRDNGDTTTISWLTISGPVSGTYTVTASPDDDSLEGQSIAYKLKTTFANFSAPAVYSTITITIGTTTCNCQLLQWNAPPAKTTLSLAVTSPTTATPITLISTTASAASKSASPPIRKCYLNSGTCDESATYTLTASKNGGGFATLPAFIVQSTTTN
jgi:hypothetical protein